MKNRKIQTMLSSLNLILSTGTEARRYYESFCNFLSTSLANHIFSETSNKFRLSKRVFKITVILDAITYFSVAKVIR